MNKEQIKSYHRRFKQWQEQPFKYTFDPDTVRHCNNCHHDFTGNFCPVCSQKAGMGRIGWSSVRQGVMDIWGLGTRSLLYTIWQLLMRPGHIIGDYIDGKRQVSFPPVKMLFIVAVIYSMVFYWFIPNVLRIQVAEPAVNEEQLKALATFSTWIKNNFSWYSLIMALLAVLPTWVFFRHSPRHTAHSLPEGFFIQVFLAVIMVVFSFLFIPLVLVNPSLSSFLSLLIYGVYYIIVYRYLFGYGLWSTLWRCGFVVSIIYFLLVSCVMFVFDVDMNAFVQGVQLSEEHQRQAKYMVATTFLIFALVTFVLGFAINELASRQDRKLAQLNRIPINADTDDNNQVMK